MKVLLKWSITRDLSNDQLQPNMPHAALQTRVPSFQRLECHGTIGHCLAVCYLAKSETLSSPEATAQCLEVAVYIHRYASFDTRSLTARIGSLHASES
jgi:hypothetical protein